MESERYTEEFLRQEEQERRGRVVLHTVPLLLFPFLAALVFGVLARLILGQDFIVRNNPLRGPVPPFAPLATLFIFATATIVLVRLGRPTISAVLLIGVWTFSTTLAALQGGVSTFLPALMIVPICAAGLLFDRLASIVLATLASGLLLLAAILEFNAIALPFSGTHLLLDNSPLVSFIFWLLLFWTVALLTSLLAGGLQQALRASRARATDLARLSAQLEERVAAQTAELLAQAQEKAALEERTRLAREIHDTLAQGLTGISVQLGAARQAAARSALPDSPAETALQTSLELAHRLARETLNEARRSVWNLRSMALERGSLAGALEGLAAYPPRSGIQISFAASGDAYPIAARIESELLRIAQEALANSGKHSQATHVSIELRYLPDSIELMVADNGTGFPAPILAGQAVSGSPWGGFGLQGIRERLQAMGGSLTLRNVQGAQVWARVPRQPAEARTEA